MLVTELVNVRYLTGYTGSNGIAFVGPELRAFATDFRYREQAAEEVDPSFERHEAPRDLVKALDAVLPGGELRLGFEAGHVSVSAFNRLDEQLPERIELVATDGLIERLRAVKQPEKSRAMRAATAIADRAFEVVLEQGLVGRTEREVALALEVEMRRAGAPAAELRDDRRLRSPRGAAARAATRRRDRRWPAGGDRLGRGARRLLL